MEDETWREGWREGGREGGRGGREGGGIGGGGRVEVRKRREGGRNVEKEQNTKYLPPKMTMRESFFFY